MSNKRKKEDLGLMKIPEKVLLEQANITIGKQAAYIQELEYNLKIARDMVDNLTKLTKAERSEVAREREGEKLYATLSRQYDEVTHLSRKQQRKIVQLTNEYAQLKIKYDKLINTPKNEL